MPCKQEATAALEQGLFEEQRHRAEAEKRADKTEEAFTELIAELNSQADIPTKLLVWRKTR